MNVDVEDLVPHTIRAWITVIVLGSVLYLLYYGVVFNSLVGVYTTELFATSPSRPYSENALSKSLEVRVDYPRHLASFGYRWIYVTIYNNDDKPAENIRVWFSANADRRAGEVVSPNNALIFPYLYHGKNYVRRSVEFDEIPPGGVVSDRLPVLAPWGEVITGTLYMEEADSKTLCNPPAMSLKFDSRNWEGKVITGTLHMEKANSKATPAKLLDLGSRDWDMNVIQSLAHGLIEFVLLPPWANGFLILAVLIITGLQDSRELDERILYRKEWCLSLLRVVMRDIGSVSVIVIFVWMSLFLPFGPGTLWSLPVVSVTVGTLCWFLQREVTKRFLTEYRSNNHRRMASEG